MFSYLQASADVAVNNNNNNSNSNDNDGYQFLSPKFLTHVSSFSITIFPFNS